MIIKHYIIQEKKLTYSPDLTGDNKPFDFAVTVVDKSTWGFFLIGFNFNMIKLHQMYQRV